MKKYILKRIIISVVTLLVILFVLFLMLEFMPGSPFNDEKLTEAQKAVLNAKYGLDKPIMVRFFHYIKSMLMGDFGVSYTISKNTPITALLETRLPISLRIGGQAILIGTLIGLMLGMIAALKHNTIYDTLTTVISVLGVSLPSYVFAMTLIYSLGFRLKWFPLLYQADSPLKSSILPTISLCMFTIATVARFTRTEMLEVLGSDYMLLAESKGLNSFSLIFRHALRNALIPIVTVLAPLVVGLMTGSLVIEKLFSIPGIGSLLVSAIQSNDYNVVIALTFIYSVMYIGIMLFVDILYGMIDPRIRLAKEAVNE
ncbi:peptide ABC transporter permease [Anaerocolumna cellulosilytica]|uniref:Peptide ABC transporter permease n=1 Tax=Anaerocolumna cellulosilytica TaxID=433286 RepID=A0A6S6QPM7_9FIRM|nr:ABC transporter permease [Anaerocolumna cellulosilytica]MBB5196157.1 oligopeptide transport system permease protein [Anaerocolumna cellulosilytica]BCJ92524.1 peptide ABC transporter permease [Anaerocolumna cellulosilytica]